MSQATVVRQAAGPAGGLNALARLFTVPVLGFFAFGLALASGLPSDRIELVGLTIATGTMILTVVAVDRTRPRERRSLLLTIFSFSYFAFFVVPVAVFYVGEHGYTIDHSPNPVPLTPEDVTRGALAAFIGYAMLLAGHWLPVGRVAANILPRMRREWSAEATLAAGLLMISVGWAFVLAIQFRLIPMRAGSGVTGALSMGASFGIGLIALCYQRYRSRAALLLLAFVCPPSMAFNFFTGGKMAFLMPLVMIVVVHVIVTRRLRIWWIAGFVAVMAVLYPVSQAYREWMYGYNLRAVQVIANPRVALNLVAGVATSMKPAEYLQQGMMTTAARLDGLSILSVITRDAGARVPFQGGWSLGYIPIAYVPRLFWPGKPTLAIGGWVTDNFGYPGVETSTGCTWIGEFYFNFGWLGIILGMLCLGFWFRFLQESFLRMDATIPALLAGVISIWTLATGVGGDMLGATNMVIFNIAPIVFLHIAVRTITPRPTRPPPPL